MKTINIETYEKEVRDFQIAQLFSYNLIISSALIELCLKLAKGIKNEKNNR